MEEVSLELNEHGYGAFVIREGEEKLAEMIVAVTGSALTIFHTEVFKAERKGMGKLLLKAMVDHSRQHQLKVNPLCLYALGQFKRHPDLYSDVWLGDGGSSSPHIDSTGK